MFRRKLSCVPLKSDPSVRRCHLSPDELVTRPAGDEVITVGDISRYIAKIYGDKPAAYYRDVVDIVEEVKQVPKADGQGQEDKVWKYFTLSEPIPVTYNQLHLRVSALTSAILALPFFEPSISIGSRPLVSIYAETCLNWQLMAQASARLGCPITTAYTTLGEEGLLTSLEVPGVQLVFCGEAQVGMISKVIGRAIKVRWVVYDGGERADKSALGTIRKVLDDRGGRLLSFGDLEELGTGSPASPSHFEIKPGPGDLFCIMYTSGSTGKPKGVLLTHGNVVASLAGSIMLWGHLLHGQADFLMAYLPLTHILEQFLEYTFFLLGVPIGYATVKTLLDDSVRNCQGDFAAYKPTLIGGVPAIYEMIRKGMMKKIREAGTVVGTVFNLAITGKQTLPWPISAMIDKVLFARVKQATGGRLRYAVCGGGALSQSTQLFLSTVLAPVMQGYGLTETCGMSTITTPEDWQLGSVGGLGPSCELKLADQSELGYLTSSSPPRGEIWLRGPNVFKGYFKQDDLTRESFTDDGWFKTGDIGQWESNGTLSVIDRVKNLVKLQNGEYLALDKVESVYKACDVVMMLCVQAPPYAERPIAIVYPHEGNLRNQLKTVNIACEGTPRQWTNNTEIKKYILSSLLETAKRGGLGRTELIKDVILTPEEWSPDNGMLTPAMKLARPEISKQYNTEIETAYGR